MIPAATDFVAVPGVGVSATVEGHEIRVGRPARSDDGDGSTAVTVTIDGRAMGTIVLVDQVRPTAAATVAALATSTSYPVQLLTGDHLGAGRQLAQQVGITDVHASLLPDDKVERVRAGRTAGRHVMVVGDGVNDAPAITAATSGIAMGRKGSDLTLETADAIVVRDELDALPPLLALSRRARRLVVANLVIAGTMIAALVTWDLVGTLPLPLAVAGHEGSTIVVALNGLRLLRRSAWTRASQTPGAEPPSAPVVGTHTL